MRNSSYLIGAAVGMLVALLFSAVESLKAAEETSGFTAGCHEYWNPTSKHESADLGPKYKNMHADPQSGRCNVHDLAD